MKFKTIYSPNFDKKERSKKSIKFIVIHYTGMQSERESLIRLCNRKSNVSSHYFIKNNGKILKLVEDYNVAWHAGKSNWKNYKNLNKNSIGIELVNKGHEFDYKNFKKKQISSLIKVCKILIKKYKIKRENVIGHSDIAPLRKIDPGEKFPWKKMANRKIGIWHNCNNKELIRSRKIKISIKFKSTFIKNLRKIGYYFFNEKKTKTVKIVKAFQRHYRQELVDGTIDKECLIIANNLLKKL
jgi:N-acetylmuramoyl-L-alanine amidase